MAEELDPMIPRYRPGRVRGEWIVFYEPMPMARFVRMFLGISLFIGSGVLAYYDKFLEASFPAALASIFLLAAAPQLKAYRFFNKEVSTFVVENYSKNPEDGYIVSWTVTGISRWGHLRTKDPAPFLALKKTVTGE